MVSFKEVLVSRPVPQAGEVVLHQLCLQCGRKAVNFDRRCWWWNEYFKDLLNFTVMPSTEGGQRQVNQGITRKLPEVGVPLVNEGDQRVFSNYLGIILLSLPGGLVRVV